MDFRGQASARSAYGLIDDWLLARPGAVLMRSDDSGVDHGVLSVGIIRHGLEKTLPNPLYRPTREARVNVLPGAETRRHIAPGNAGPKLPDHSLDKQPIAEFAIAPNMSGTARHQTIPRYSHPLRKDRPQFPRRIATRLRAGLAQMRTRPSRVATIVQT